MKQRHMHPKGLEPVGYTLDEREGVAYIYFGEMAQAVERTVQVTPWLLVDYDAAGRPLGVELLRLDLRGV